MPMSPHRPALAAILVATLAVLGLLATTPVFAAEPPPAQAPAALPPPPPLDPTMDRLPATAMRYLGTYQGECWTFVQKMVKEALGRDMGFEYRQGFFDAGAIEVSPKDAKSGDVIQIARDSNTAADADYPGLHTAMIIAPAPDGKFKVIDSNSRYDGIVRVRDSYDPAESAGRYPGLSFHIYRFQGKPSIAPPLPKVQLAAAPLSPTAPGPVTSSAADRAVVKTDDGSCLFLREGPQGAILVCLPDGTSLVILNDPILAAGRSWMHVRTPADGDGWVAGEFVSRVATAQESAVSGGTVKQLKTYRTFIPLAASDD